MFFFKEFKIKKEKEKKNTFNVNYGREKTNLKIKKPLTKQLIFFNQTV